MTKEIKQEQGKPVAWLIDDKSINHLQIKTIQRLIERANHAHMTDIKLRINGQDEWYEGDWIKHMVEAPQPKQEQDEPDDLTIAYMTGLYDGKKQAKQEQGEPVAWFREENGEKIYYATKAWDDCLALYATSKNKEWVGLTEDEIYKIAFQLEGEHWKKISNAIEAKLKEKNS